MQSFENLIRASATELVSTLSALRGRVKGEGEARRLQFTQLLGLVNPVQLICAIGFNPESARIPELPRFLGFANRETLLSERNFLFIHDRYMTLRAGDVVDIYVAMGAAREAVSGWSDLVLSRLHNIEAQLEETINPVLISGYKLEIRAIYEQRLVDAALVASRTSLNYSVLRELTGEGLLMLETGVVEPGVFLSSPNFTPEEKARGVFHGRLQPDRVKAYLAATPLPADVPVLTAALKALP